MADIIAFPTRDSLRLEALDRLAKHLAQHMTGVLYDRNILHVPVQAFTRGMCEIMLDDGFDYDPVVIDGLLADPVVLDRFEEMFLRVLSEKGIIS